MASEANIAIGRRTRLAIMVGLPVEGPHGNAGAVTAVPDCAPGRGKKQADRDAMERSPSVASFPRTSGNGVKLMRTVLLWGLGIPIPVLILLHLFNVI